MMVRRVRSRDISENYQVDFELGVPAIESCILASKRALAQCVRLCMRARVRVCTRVKVLLGICTTIMNNYIHYIHAPQRQ